MAADLKKKVLIGAKRKGEEAMGFGTEGVNPDVEKGYEKIEDMVKDAKAVKEQLSKTSDEIEKISAEFRAKEAEKAAQAREAQAAQQPVQEATPVVDAQPEQIIPIELPEENGPVLKR